VLVFSSFLPFLDLLTIEHNGSFSLNNSCKGLRVKFYDLTIRHLLFACYLCYFEKKGSNILDKEHIFLNQSLSSHSRIQFGFISIISNLQESVFNVVISFEYMLHAGLKVLGEVESLGTQI